MFVLNDANAFHMKKFVMCSSAILFLMGLFLITDSHLLIRWKLYRMTSTPIVFSNDILKVIGECVEPVGSSLDTGAKFVIHIDSLECGTCRINKLGIYESVFKLSDSLGTFQPVILISPPKGEAEKIIRYIQHLKGYPPIYIDSANVFFSDNGAIPHDARFHHYLLNKDNRPVFVGNPVSDDRMNSLFIEAINNLSNL